MELWQLRTFSVVAKNLHFTRAAEELNLSQPAVSHQIKSLEKEIGEPLFLRDKEGILLTKAGQTMYQHATKILDIADELRLEVKDNQDALSGKIILGAATKGLSNPFAFFYDNFIKTYPKIKLIFQTENTLEDVVDKVKEGKIDIGVISHHPDLSGLTIIPFAEYKIFPVAQKNHHLAQKQEVTAEDLQNEEWLMYEPGNRIRLLAEDFLNKAGIVPKDFYATNDGQLIRSMIVHGNRISILPEWGIIEEMKNGTIVKLNFDKLDYKIQINLIWKPNRRTKVMSAVLGYLIEERMEGVQSLKSRE